MEGEAGRGEQQEKEVASRKKSALYTRTGDRGESSLYTGERRPKEDPIFDALGAVDELNSCIGLANEYCKLTDNGLNNFLEEIQSRLLDIGSSIATPATPGAEHKRDKVAFAEHHTDRVEEWIDNLDCQLPKLTRFILPSGGLSSAHLHVARTVCRRAERLAVHLLNQNAVEASVVKYLNRLSDFLFVAARFAAMKEGKSEVTYKLGEGPKERPLEKAQSS